MSPKQPDPQPAPKPDPRENVLKIKLTGGRFDKNMGLPLEDTAILAKLNSFFREVARDLFFADHTDRHRLPGKFQESWRPVLESSVPGSFDFVVKMDANAIATTVSEVPGATMETLTASTPQPPGADNRADLDAPKKPEWMSPRAAAAYQSVLEELETDEAIGAIYFDGRSSTVERHALKIVESWASAPKQVTSEFTIVGTVYGLRDDKKNLSTIELGTKEYGRRRQIPIQSHLRDSLAELLKSNACIRLSGVASSNEEGRVVEYVLAEKFLPIGGPELTPRLEALKARVAPVTGFKLPKSWMYTVLSRQLWSALHLEICHRPHVFSPADGSLVMLWRTKEADLSIALRDDRKFHGQWVVLAKDSETERRTADSLTQLIPWIRTVCPRLAL